MEHRVLLRLVLPPLQSGSARAQIDRLDVGAGDALRPGSRLLEYTVGFDDAAMHDCPPITTYRMILSETAWLRDIKVTAGASVEPGEVLALLSTTPDEPASSAPARGARTTVAAIIKPPVW